MSNTCTGGWMYQLGLSYSATVTRSVLLSTENISQLSLKSNQFVICVFFEQDNLI